MAALAAWIGIVAASVAAGVWSWRRDPVWIVLFVANLAAASPWVGGFFLAMGGGNPTPQLGDPDLWRTWYVAWYFLGAALFLSFVAAVGAAGVSAYRKHWPLFGWAVLTLIHAWAGHGGWQILSPS